MGLLLELVCFFELSSLSTGTPMQYNCRQQTEVVNIVGFIHTSRVLVATVIHEMFKTFMSQLTDGTKITRNDWLRFLAIAMSALSVNCLQP
jgi:hypothetical protein